jgi:hypothetical protein
MKDDLHDIAALDASALGPGDVAALGDSALGHAVRRARALYDSPQDACSADPVAAHDSHV